MNKITGTIIDAGYHLDAGPGVSIAANAGELRVWDGPLYGRRVVIVDETDYDAREEGIEQLCEQMGQLRVALAAREAEEERLRDVKLQRVAEGMSKWCKPQSPHLDAIADALDAGHCRQDQEYFEAERRC